MCVCGPEKGETRLEARRKQEFPAKNIGARMARTCLRDEQVISGDIAIGDQTILPGRIARCRKYGL